MSPTNDHLLKKIVDNRDGMWECEECQQEPETIAIILRGGYIQEVLCSECYTHLHPKDEIMVGEGVGTDVHTS